MEKEPQPDSLTDVTVKQYAASEVYSTEPPPAYHRPQSTAVQVAKIAAITIVAVSVVLGCFILAAAYVQANASCKEWEQEMMLIREEARLQQNYQQPPLQPEALIQEEPQDKHHQDHSETQDATNTNKVESDDSNLPESSESDDVSSEEEDHTPIHIKLPLQLDFDELAGALMEKNQRSRMNCIVEKKKAEEVIDHQPKTVRLPFGLNLTTDPRYEHVTGERMAIFCESGDEQRQVPQQQEETMMVQPIIVPLGNPMMPLHHVSQPQPRPEQMEAIRAHTIIMEQVPPRQQIPVPAQHQMPPQPNQLPPQMPHPNQIMHQIAQQIAQHEIAMARQHQQQQQQQQQQHQHEQHEAMMHPQLIPIKSVEEPRAHQIPPEALIAAHRLQQVPEEVLTQINRLPNHEQHVISVSVQEQEGEEVPHEEIRVVQHPRENAQEMNGRQNYARGLPINIPVPVMQQQEQQARPHYVQPRSVRSVDNILHREKRVKRCSCDCAC